MYSVVKPLISVILKYSRVRFSDFFKLFQDFQEMFEKDQIDVIFKG